MQTSVINIFLANQPTKVYGAKVHGNSKHTLDILPLVASSNERYANTRNRGWNILLK